MIINPYVFAGFSNNYSTLFDGVDEYADCGDIGGTLDNASTISYSFWLKPLVAGSEYFLGWFGAGNSYFYVNIDVNKRLKGSISDGTTSLSMRTADNAVTLNVWQYVTVIYDASETPSTNALKFFVDGSQVASILVSGTTPSDVGTLSNNLFLGAVNATSNANCYLDEVAVFDYALSLSELIDIFNVGVPTDLMNLESSKQPEHYYRMGDGDTFPTITDHGATGGNNGTMTNMESGDFTTDVI
jgi:hypothetical protein